MADPTMINNSPEKIISSKISSICGKYFSQNAWQTASIALAVLFFVLSLRWGYIDQCPPRWDEAMYLVQATVFHQELITHGMLSFLHQVFNYDRGHGILIPLVVQPFFLLFGPSLKVAVAVLNIFWFVLAWALYGVTRDIAGRDIGNRAGFFAFALFSLYPLTTELSNYYLVEFPLVALVCAMQYSILRFYNTHNRKWLFVGGEFLVLAC